MTLIPSPIASVVGAKTLFKPGGFMLAKHQTTLHTRCPYAPVWDYYDVTVETSEFLQCEKLQAVCDEIRGKELTQEQVFQHIRDGVKLQGSVVIVEGSHGQNGRLVISG